MEAAFREGRPLFRVWIVRFGKWRPKAWDELPPRATAVEPADAAGMSAREAVRFLEGFNRTMLARAAASPGEPDDSSRVWAVAIPVSIRYDGDLHVGAIIARGRTKLLDCKAREFAEERDELQTVG